MKRLFLFAAFDPQGVEGPCLKYYLDALAPHGDIVLCADGDMDITPFPSLIHCITGPHGEYDFGSYKRAFEWVISPEGPGLDKYDRMYLVNDSVIGPLADMRTLLTKLDDSCASAVSPVWNVHRDHPHLESWFIGLTPDIFRATWFASFLRSVRKLNSKRDVCVVLENGFSRQLMLRGIDCKGLYNLKGRSVYNDVYKLHRRGFPFIKKSSFFRHASSLGRQIRLSLKDADPVLKEAVRQDFERFSGGVTYEEFSSAGPMETMRRYIKYLHSKV